jgi:hypothetical protein
MAGYRILSLIQSVFILFTAISVLDANDNIGMNVAFFGSSTSFWWSAFAFWAYCFAIVAILQIVKAFIVQEKL